jgi:hypothetical protein
MYVKIARDIRAHGHIIRARTIRVYFTTSFTTSFTTGTLAYHIIGTLFSHIFTEWVLRTNILNLLCRGLLTLVY